MNLYGFAAGDPVNFSDPLGLSPCANLRAAIQRKFSAYRNEWFKYQKWHGRGASNYGHYEDLTNLRNGLENSLEEYGDEECDDDDDHPGFGPTLNKIHDFLQRPVPAPRQPRPESSSMRAPTAEELRSAAAAAAAAAATAIAIAVMILSG